MCSFIKEVFNIYYVISNYYYYYFVIINSLHSCSSGKCQILHWRQVHKHECQLLEANSGCSSPKSASNEDLFSINEQVPITETLNSNIGHEIDDSFEASRGPVSEIKSSEKRNRCKINKEVSREDSDVLDSVPDTCSTSYDNNTPFKEPHIRHKVSFFNFIFIHF